MSIISSLEKIYARLGGPNIQVNLNDFKIEFEFPDNNKDSKIPKSSNTQTEEESKSIWLSAMGIKKDERN